MAQTAPPPLSGEGTPRPLPRGSGRPPRTRDTRPRFQPLDALWMAVLAALFAALGVMRHVDAFGLTAATGVLLLTYLLGWRASGRPAGVISGLLLATSVPFEILSAHALTADLFALAALGALFAFVAGSSLAALVLAAAAVWLRADGLALGLMLMTFTLIQHRRRSWLGALLFFVPTLAALFMPQAGTFSAVTFDFQPTLWAGLAAPAMLFTAWFLLPFFGEMADPVRRARWLPVVVWTGLYTLLASVLRMGHANVLTAVLVPFLPLGFLLVGAGLARLLPVMTGDLPIPALRYVVATLAVLSLVAIRVRVEWPVVSHRAVTPSAPAVTKAAAVFVAPVQPPPLLAPKLKPVPHRPVSYKAVTVHPKTFPNGVKAPRIMPATVKPPVRLYVVKNGKLVHRSKWAIQWDLTHPRP